jgi:hypothetical protein
MLVLDPGNFIDVKAFDISCVKKLWLVAPLACDHDFRQGLLGVS